MMNLHRAGSKPQWDGVPSKKRNTWQDLAVSTNGILTPGNALTILGFAMVLSGLMYILQEQYWLGAVYIGIGRLLDIADGQAAEYTKTKSPLGEQLDAGFDKLATVLILIALPAASVLPWSLAIALLAPHVAIAAYSAYRIAHFQQLHPSKFGKISMALAWVSLVALLVGHAVAADKTTVLHIIGYITAASSIAYGVAAFWHYVNTGNTGQSKPK